MSKIENLVKEYGSKKLKEIVEQQSFAYSKTFLAYAKSELIRRGETIKLDSEFEERIAAMSDSYLKNIVENEWQNYSLEYLEIARKEYLKRNFKNETTDEEPVEQQSETTVKKRYLALRTIANVYWVLAFLVVIITVILFVAGLSTGELYGFENLGYVGAILALFIGGFVALILFAIEESIRIFIHIEENTRKTVECLSKK